MPLPTDSQQSMEDAITMFEVIGRRIANPDYKLTSSEEELMLKYSEVYKDNIARVQAGGKWSSEPVDQKKAEKLTSRLSAISAQMHTVFRSILEPRRPAHDSPAPFQPRTGEPSELVITEADLPRSLGQRDLEGQ